MLLVANALSRMIVLALAIAMLMANANAADLGSSMKDEPAPARHGS